MVQLSGEVAADLVGAAITGHNAAADARRLAQAVAELSMPVDSHATAQHWRDAFHGQLGRRTPNASVAAALQAVDAVLEECFPTAPPVDIPPQTPTTMVFHPDRAAPSAPPLDPYQHPLDAVGDSRSSVTTVRPAPAPPAPAEPDASWTQKLSTRQRMALAALAGALLVVGTTFAVVKLTEAGSQGTIATATPPTTAEASPSGVTVASSDPPPTEEVPSGGQVPELPPGVTILRYEVAVGAVAKAAVNPELYFGQCMRDVKVMAYIQIFWRQNAADQKPVDKLQKRLRELSKIDVQLHEMGRDGQPDSGPGLVVACHRK
ncbi:hypothetical protein ACFQX7_01205 [Luedemannella flava]